MVGSILPVVYGARQRGHRASDHWIHLVASVLGAAAFGAGLAFVGRLVGATDQVGAGIAGLVAAVYLLRALDVLRIPAPERGKQVPAAWRVTLPAKVTAALYGGALGLPVLTHIWALTMYPILIWLALGTTPLGAAIVWSAYGLGRALPLLVIQRRTTNAAQAFEISRLLDRWSRVIRVLDGVALSAAMGLFVGFAFP